MIRNTHDQQESGAPFDPAAYNELRHGNRRRCIVTGETKGKEWLVRFVVGPDGTVVPDIDERLPGRGFWLSARRDVVEKAGAKRVFARAARQSVSVSGDLADRVERLLARRCVETIGLARRSGAVVYGHDQVRAWLSRNRCGVLVGASDGALMARKRMRAVAQAPTVEVLTGCELGAALGCERTVHLAMAPGRLADRLRHDANRLAGFRDVCSPVGQALNG